jgi:predicted DNA repair protein MutK
VAGIVKLDDLGAWLGRRTQPVLRAAGRGLLRVAPWLMKALSWRARRRCSSWAAASSCMASACCNHAVEGAAERLGELPGVGAVFAALTPMVLNAVAGIVTGADRARRVMAFQRLRGRGRAVA